MIGESISGKIAHKLLDFEVECGPNSQVITRKEEGEYYKSFIHDFPSNNWVGWVPLWYDDNFNGDLSPYTDDLSIYSITPDKFFDVLTPNPDNWWEEGRCPIESIVVEMLDGSPFPDIPRANYQTAINLENQWTRRLSLDDRLSTHVTDTVVDNELFVIFDTYFYYDGFSDTNG